MHPEPIGLLSHVFFSLTFPVILGPNITGTSSKILYLGQGLGNSGAFSISDYASGASSGGGFAYKLSFNASESNNVYTALTVQPPSGYSLMIIKE